MSTLLRSEIDLNVFIDDLLALGKYWSSNFKKKTWANSLLLPIVHVFVDLDNIRP